MKCREAAALVINDSKSVAGTYKAKDSHHVLSSTLAARFLSYEGDIRKLSNSSSICKLIPTQNDQFALCATVAGDVHPLVLIFGD
jgi:hypothetical protein